MVEMTTKLLQCECNSTEHIVIVGRILDDIYPEDNMVYLHIHLSERIWYERLWHAVKYIFGYRCKFGDFDEVLLDKDKLKEMLKSLDY